MNFLSHARHFLDDPYVALGTGLPDLISMADRRNRLRRTALPTTGSYAELALARGAEIHFADDIVFHQSADFRSVTSEVAAMIRRDNGSRRASTLAHVLIELMLDSILIRRDPSLPVRYDRALQGLNIELVSDSVTRWLSRPSVRLPTVLARFRRSRFWHAYATDEGVFWSLEMVSRRVGLGSTRGIDTSARAIRDRVADLESALFAGTAGE